MKLLVKDADYGNGKIYGFCKNINLLFSVDIVRETTEFLSVVPDDFIGCEEICGYVHYFNEKIYLAPLQAHKIWIYDLAHHQWDSLDLRNKNLSYGGIHLIIQHSEKLFFIGSRYPSIVCLNMDLNTIRYIEEPYKDMQRRNAILADAYFRAEYVKENNIIYLASCMDNYVLEFDMDTFQYCWHEVGKKGNRYSGIMATDTCYWLAPRGNSSIVSWDKKNDVEFDLPSIFADKGNYFLGAFYDEGKILFPNQNEPGSIILNPDSGEMTIIDIKYMFFKRKDSTQIYQFEDGTLFFENEYGERKTFDLSVPIKKLDKFYKDIDLTLNKKLFYEKETDLKEFMTELLDLYTNTFALNSEKVGKKIWEEVVNVGEYNNCWSQY